MDDAREEATLMTEANRSWGENLVAYLQSLLRLEWHFLAPSLVALAGLLPFALFGMGRAGTIAGAMWAVIYVFIIGWSVPLYLLSIRDAVRVLFGKEARFLALVERALADRGPDFELRIFMYLGTFMNPLWVTGVLSMWFVQQRGQVTKSDGEEGSHVGPSEVAIYYQVQRSEPFMRPRDSDPHMPVVVG